MSPQSIILAGGCFRCLAEVYELVDGIVAVDSGNGNSHLPQPRFEHVCRSDAGHAEVVRPDFDTCRTPLEAREFCNATDGFLHLLTPGAARRVDPGSGEFTTWLR